MECKAKSASHRNGRVCLGVQKCNAIARAVFGRQKQLWEGKAASEMLSLSFRSENSDLGGIHSLNQSCNAVS